MKKWLIPVVVIAVIAIMFITGYNSLVSLEENINGKWSQIENQLQRRYDLIPNLVATVKGYAAHEQEIFTQVAEARAKLAGAATPAQYAEAEQEVSSALNRLLAISENYPQLKADANFRQLQDELAGTENRIATARKDYNEAVQVYNGKIRRFPAVIFARLFGFEPKEYFQITEEARQAPQVNFND